MTESSYRLATVQKKCCFLLSAGCVCSRLNRSQALQEGDCWGDVDVVLNDKYMRRGGVGGDFECNS